MSAKIIVIEGTDCSGKETQTKLLVSKLIKDGYRVGTMSFPVYNSATGIIIGACLLGKPDMCKKYLKKEEGFFKEGGGNIDAITACDLYAADRRYNLPKLLELVNNNDIVILDRYVFSNMAHRGGLIENKEERLKIYKKIELLEYDINELPRPDEVYLLYLPFKYSTQLKINRKEELDTAEKDETYLKKGENAYLELASIYNFNIINCYNDNGIRDIEDINKELYRKVKRKIKV